MSYRHVVAVSAVLAGCLVTAGAQAPVRSGGRPNVVLIVTDDVGYGDFGSYGAPDVRTPNVDSLARDGIRLTDFYANGSTCSPTRAGLISGRYQQRYTIETPLPGPGPRGERGLTATGRSLPQLLKNNGYATALIGKWHLGYAPAQSPNAHGFDYFFGFKSGYIDYYMHTGGNGEPDLYENDSPVMRDGYMTDLITAGAVSFVERNAALPFFLDVAYNAAHWPYQPPDLPSRAPGNARHMQPHDDGTSVRSQYVAMLERADRGVGEILRTLERLGLAQNTLVIFTNDNGGEWLARNEPLFHRKQTLWEGGIRVPALVRWPGRIPAGRVSDQVGMTMDFTASILAATGTAVPDSVRLEGVNLLPILEGMAPEVERTLFWRNVTPHAQRAVRRGDWKLLVDGGPNGPELLFNLRQDVGERHDMASQRQDIARALRPLLSAWEADVDAEAKSTEARLASPADRR
jgi:arylsulfatase A-like enzyme